MKNVLFIAVLISLGRFGFSQKTIDFEGFELESGEFLNGDDLSGGFTADDIFLPNNYNPDWMSWTGWAISSTVDVMTPGFSNQYSAIVGKGVNESLTYGVSFASSGSVIHLKGDAMGQPIDGMYVTNTTYAYLSMLEGDSFTKKFGGITGDDPDYFKLTIKKYHEGSLSQDSVDFYLADLRSEDNTKDYILKEWKYVDLSELGTVDSLLFSLSSTDNGAFGMNTPAYFAVDDIKISGKTSSLSENYLSDVIVYPNPAQNIINVTGENVEKVEIFDISQRKLKATPSKMLDISGFKNGFYILKIYVENQVLEKRVQIVR